MSRLRNRRCCIVPLLAVLGTGCDPPGRPDAADRPVPADQIVEFDVLFKAHCAGCHGADGKLGPAPPLNDPLFLAIVPDGELLRVIRGGRAVTPAQKSPMPAFAVVGNSRLSPEQAAAWARLKEKAHAVPKQQGVLTDAQVQVLARGIKKQWGPVKPAPSGAPPYLQGGSNIEAVPVKPAGGEVIPVPPRPDAPPKPAAAQFRNREDGAAAFARACASCHGDHGQGGQLDDKPVGAINDPAFLALISDQELRRYAITGRPDLGMPPYDGKAGRSADFQPLTSEEIDGLVALLASWRLGGSAKGK